MNAIQKYKKPLIIITIIILCVVGLWRYMEYHRMHNPNRNHPPMEITANPRTFCIGRTLVDLPQGLYPDDPAITPLIRSTVELDGVRVEVYPNVSLKEFNRMVTNRWTEVQTYTHDIYDAAYVKPSQHYQVRDNGWILAFNHEEIKSNVREENGVLVHDKKIYYDAEGYFWDRGTMFTFKDSGVQIAEEIADLIQRSHFRNVSEVPQEAGICLNSGFIQIYYLSKTEDFSWELEHPSFRLSFGSGSRVAEKTLLQGIFGSLPPTHSERGEVSVMDGMAHRVASRPDDPLPGEEVVVSSTIYYTNEQPREYTSEVLLMWEYKGQPRPEPQPTLGATLGFKHKSTERPNTLGDYPNQTTSSAYPSKEEFFALWDAIVSTICFYPGALTPKPEPPKPEERPGPSAAQKARERQILDDFLRNG